MSLAIERPTHAERTCSGGGRRRVAAARGRGRDPAIAGKFRFTGGEIPAVRDELRAAARRGRRSSPPEPPAPPRAAPRALGGGPGFSPPVKRNLPAIAGISAATSGGSDAPSALRQSRVRSACVGRSIARLMNEARSTERRAPSATPPPRTLIRRGRRACGRRPLARRRARLRAARRSRPS